MQNILHVLEIGFVTVFVGIGIGLLLGLILGVMFRVADFIAGDEGKA